MKYAALKIEPWTEGDEWEGLPNVKITVGPEGGPYAAPSQPLALVTMRFKKYGDVPSEVIELSSAEAGQITLIDAANWTFSIPPQVIPNLTRGKWTWRIRCKDDTLTGRPKTYLGDEVTILETV